MNTTTPLDFRSFYFYELLSTIRKQSADSYGEEELGYLRKLLDFLECEENAQNGIEKLARSQLTSDLAIFFSDMLEHLPNLSPDEAVAKIPERANEFLDIFQVYLQQEDWKESLVKFMESPLEEVEESEQQPLSFDEYYLYALEDILSRKAEEQQTSLSPEVMNFLHKVLKEPEAFQHLEKNITDSRINELSRLYHTLFPTPEEKDPLQLMDNFEENGTLFTEKLLELASEYPQSFTEAPAEVEAATEETVQEERPLEELFEQVAQEDTSAEEFETKEDIEALTEQFLSRDASSKTLSEEERTRRKFLRDYVIGEVNAYKEDILHTLHKLLSNGEDPSAIGELKEHLKGLKDLGQIHAYPGVEKVAEALLSITQHLQTAKKYFQGETEEKINNLLSILPDYINAAVEEVETPLINQIDQKINDVRSKLLVEEAEGLPFSDPNVREKAFGDVASRTISELIRTLEAGDSSSFPGKANQLTEDLLFWSQQHGLDGATEFWKKFQEISQQTSPDQLNDSQQQSLRNLLQQLGDQYTHISAREWQDFTQQLQEIFEELPASYAAFKDVHLRNIYQLKEMLNTTEDLENFVTHPLREFFADLQENSALIHNDSLELLARMLEIKIDAFTGKFITDKDSFRADLNAFLDHLENEFQNIPNEINAETLLLEFDNLLHEMPSMAEEEPTSTVDTSSFVEEEPQVEAPEQVTSDLGVISEPQEDTEDIQQVFNLEALGYVNEIQDKLSQLRSDPDNPDFRRQLGVVMHTLKGSAQMVERSDISELVTPMDEVCHHIEKDTLLVTPQLLDIMDEMVELVRKRLNGEAVEPEKVLDQLKLYQSSYLIGEPEEATAESDVEAVEFQSEEAIVSEMPSAEKVLEEEEYIFLQEQDQELLEIFQSEVTNNFTLIDKHLDNLEKYTYDKEVLREVERAVHEIRSAAKMLGIGEIAAIGDPLEQIVEKIIHQRPENFHGLIPMLRNAMIVVKELTTQHRVRKSDYENTLNELNTYLETGEVLVTEPEQPSLAADLATRDVVYEPEGKREVSPQVIEMFVHEAREQLDDINYLLLKLEKDPQNEDLQHHLMRCMHTLKGSAGMVYSNKIENLAHRCEDIIEYYIQQHQPLPESLFDTLFRVVDEMNGALDSIKDNQEETLKNYDQLMAALDKYSLKAAPAETPRPTPPEPEPKKKEVPSESATPSQFYPMPPQKKDTFIRLNINTMNHLLNLAAELVISNNQFKSQLDRLKELSPQLNSHLKLFRDTEDYISTIIRESNRLQEGLMDLLADSPGATESLKNQQEKLQQILKNVRNLQDEFTSISHILKDNSKTYDENLQKLNKLSNELLDEILQARLVPINLLFQRFHRPIRDLARQMQKQIRLKMSGEDTELDRRLIEDLYEPLLHIIRNAIDHGIESEEERKAAGKPPEGLIEIKASRDRNQVIVEISDDGRGIDVEKIKQKALEKGLIDEEESEKLSDLEVFEFLFHSGFTTSEDTTMVSGRGVGLDVVKSQIEKAKGDIRIYTEKGKGTTFSIRVPISLSVIQSMLVEVNGHVYSIPLLQVEETLSVNVEDIVTDEGKQYIRYRERKIPVIHLNQLLKVRDENKPPQLTPDQYPVIIVQDEGNRASLLVDKIIRREEILIKSLGPGLKRLKYISGGSIMADGQVVLVLDVPQIIQDSIRGLLGASGEGEGTETLKSRVKKSPPPSRQKKIIEGRKPAVLIVDDSLSIRKYLSSLLMQNGYKTETARNGYEALELLNKHHFDLMVTDLEMPKLSGYELIETLRYDQRFSSFPIIVLTGRAGENFRELTTELGADAYIVKPFNDRELLNQIEAFIEYKA